MAICIISLSHYEFSNAGVDAQFDTANFLKVNLKVDDSRSDEHGSS